MGHSSFSRRCSYKFSEKFAFIPILYFQKNQKQSSFLQVGGLITRNISALFSKRVLLIIVPWYSIVFYFANPKPFSETTSLENVQEPQKIANDQCDRIFAIFLFVCLFVLSVEEYDSFIGFYLFLLPRDFSSQTDCNWNCNNVCDLFSRVVSSVNDH